MPPHDPSSNHRNFAIPSGIAGVLFLIVAVLGREWDWRGGMAFVSGILYLIIGARQYRKAASADCHSTDARPERSEQ